MLKILKNKLSQILKFSFTYFKQLCGCLALGVMMLGGCADRCDDQAKVIKIGVSADTPPFEFLKIEGGQPKLKGLDIDIITRILKNAGKQYKIINMAFDGLIPALKNGRIDLAISAISPSEEREKSISFSRVYYRSKIVMLVSKNTMVENWSKDWNGKTIGAQTGSIFIDWLEGLKKDNVMRFKSVYLSNLLDLTQDLKLGRINGIIVSELAAQAFLNIEPNYKIYYVPFAPIIKFAIAFRKKSPLLNIVNEQMLTMEANGTINSIIKKWLLHARRS